MPSNKYSVHLFEAEDNLAFKKGIMISLWVNEDCLQKYFMKGTQSVFL